jgi:hypothetical protein
MVEHPCRHGLFKRPLEIIIVRGMTAKLYRRITDLIAFDERLDAPTQRHQSRLFTVTQYNLPNKVDP